MIDLRQGLSQDRDRSVANELLCRLQIRRTQLESIESGPTPDVMASIIALAAAYRRAADVVELFSSVQSR